MNAIELSDKLRAALEADGLVQFREFEIECEPDEGLIFAIGELDLMADVLWRFCQEYGLAMALDPDDERTMILAEEAQDPKLHDMLSLCAQGATAHQEGDPRTALIYYERAMLRYPDAWQPHNNAGHAYFTLGNYEIAKKLYVRAIELAPGEHSPHLGLGLCYAREHANESAARHFKRAGELGAGWAAWKALALALLRLAVRSPNGFERDYRLNEANDAIVLAIGTGGDATCHYAQAVICCARNERPTALLALESAFIEDPNLIAEAIKEPALRGVRYGLAFWALVLKYRKGKQ